MCFAIKAKMIRIMKKPVFAIGLIVMLIFVYIQCGRYLDIDYLSVNSQIKPVDEELIGDADVMDGYIPMSEEEYYIDRMCSFRDNLIKNVGMDEYQVNEMMNTAFTLERQDAIDFLERECPFVVDLSGYFSSGEGKKLGTATEINGYISEALTKENFMDYLGRKYVDYLGTIFVFFCLILYPFYFYPDSRKGIYEILHTKPVSGKKYILLQALGSMLIGLFAVVVITLIFQGFVFANKDRFDFTVNTARIWKYTLWCLIPTIIYISAVFSFFSVLFKSPLPALPFIFMQILYSNAGVASANGRFVYKHRLGAILIRYPEMFFETGLSETFCAKQAFILVLGVVILVATDILWEKKRI